jgi:hypothetical protein
MQSFKYEEKTVIFSVVQGVVLGQTKYTETHVSSSGGGGYVGKHGGKIEAPTIDSEIITKHEFWLKKSDGVEQCIKLTDCDIPVRTGQQVSVISAKLQDSHKKQFVALINHNAKRHWMINSAEKLNKQLGIETPTGMSLMLSIGIWFLVGIIFSSVIFGGLVAFVTFVTRAIMKTNRITEVNDNLKKHINQLIRDIESQF